MIRKIAPKGPKNLRGVGHDPAPKSVQKKGAPAKVAAQDKFQKAESTAEQYGKWVNAYDADTASYGWSAPEKLLHAVAQVAPPDAGQRVLDVGLGTGQASEPYVAARAQVTGVDISPEMLEEAKQKLPGLHHVGRYDINDSLSTVGVKPGSYDVVLSSGTLHFAKDLKATLTELSAALGEGGTLAFTFIPPQERKFGPNTTPVDPEAVTAHLQSLGLSIKSTDQFVAYYDKGNKDDPVRYAMVVAQRPGQRAPGGPVLDRTASVDRPRVMELAQKPLAQSHQSTTWTDKAVDTKSLLAQLDKQLAAGEIDITQISFPKTTAAAAKAGKPGVDALVLLAHPDDESVYTGGTLARLASAGKSVHLVSVTDGGGGRAEAGVDLAALRKGELAGAQKALGLDDVTLLAHKDIGKYRDEHRAEPLTAADTLRAWGTSAVVDDFVAQIRAKRPTSLLTFDAERDPNYSLHGHHMATGVAASLAFHLAADPNYKPDLGKPWAASEQLTIVPEGASGGTQTAVSIDPERKRNALRAHASQGFSLQRSIEKPGKTETWNRFQARDDSAVLGDLGPRPRFSLEGQTRPPLLDKMLAGDATVSKLYRVKTPKARYQALQKRDYPRAQVADLIGKQMKARGADHPALLANLEKLRDDNTAVVVTGQQTGVLGGPNYSLFKALGAVTRAKELSDDGMPTVPVFWLASYDADRKEVAAVSVLSGARDVKKLELKGEDGGAVGDMKLGADIGRILDEVEGMLSGPHKKEAMALARSIYKKDETYAGAFTKLLGAMTDRFGLLVLDPNRKEFAALATSTIEKELFGPGQSAEPIALANAVLDEADLPQQVHSGADRLNVFLVDDNGDRVFLQRQEGGFLTGGKPKFLSNDAARKMLEGSPERFSPSALLRPVVEDTVLPTMAYIGGPAEVSYFAQIGGVYDWADVPMPEVAMRPGFTLARGEDLALLEDASGGSVGDFMRSEGQDARLGWAGLPKDVAEAYENLDVVAQTAYGFVERCQKELFPKRDMAQASALFGQLQQTVSAALSDVESKVTDAGIERLQKGLGFQLPNIEKRLATFAASVKSAEENPAETPKLGVLNKGLRDMRSLVGQAVKAGRQQRPELTEAFDRIRPQGKKQERIMSLVQLISEAGPDVGELLLDEARVNEDVRLVELS